MEAAAATLAGRHAVTRGLLDVNLLADDGRIRRVVGSRARHEAGTGDDGQRRVTREHARHRRLDEMRRSR